MSTYWESFAQNLGQAFSRSFKFLHVAVRIQIILKLVAISIEDAIKGKLLSSYSILYHHIVLILWDISTRV